MIDDKDVPGLFGQALLAAGTAWGLVVKLFGGRLSAIEAAVKAQAVIDDERHSKLRDETRGELRGLENKIDRNHEVVMDNLLSIQGQLSVRSSGRKGDD